jgi:integrase
MIITPEQAYVIVRNLREPERTLTLLAAGTGLRISECPGLQWQDVNFAEAMIHVRRTWTGGQVGLPKTKASKGPVPLHPLLAEFMLRWKEKTAYPEPCDWVFASFRLKGKQPRVANMLVEDYLRPPQRRLEFFHRIEMTAGDWWRTIHAGSDFTTFVTVSHRSWFASEPIQRRCKLCFATAMSN